MDIDWEDARIFLAVCEAGAFSAAARRLQLGQPTVSRRIAALEDRLGAALFERDRGGARPTQAALDLQVPAQEMARWAAEFERLAEGRERDPGGVVRIAAPPGIAVEHLAPFAAMLAREHPELRLSVLAGVEHIDLVRGGADLAVRTRPPLEPELMSLASGRTRVGVYAAASYAARVVGEPGWADLDWITWTGARSGVAPRPMLERVVPDFRPAFESDDYLVQLAALSAGLGAMVLGAPAADGPFASLVRIPMEVDLPDAEFHLVCARSARHIPRVRRVSDLLMARMATSVL